MSMTFKPGNDSGDRFPDSVPDLRTDELGKFGPNDDNGLEDTGSGARESMIPRFFPVYSLADYLKAEDRLTPLCRRVIFT